MFIHDRLPPPTASSPLPSHSGSLEPRLKELQENELEKSGFKAQRESCHPQQPPEASLSNTHSRTMKCGKGIVTIATLPPVHCRLSKTTWGLAPSVTFSAVLHRGAPQGPPCSSPTPSVTGATSESHSEDWHTGAAVSLQRTLLSASSLAGRLGEHRLLSHLVNCFK